MTGQKRKHIFLFFYFLCFFQPDDIHILHSIFQFLLRCPHINYITILQLFNIPEIRLSPVSPVRCNDTILPFFLWKSTFFEYIRILPACFLLHSFVCFYVHAHTFLQMPVLLSPADLLPHPDKSTDIFQVTTKQSPQALSFSSLRCPLSF